MKRIKQLAEGLNSQDNILTEPITIQLTKLQKARYNHIRLKIREINPKVQMANFMRKAIFDLFDNLEDLINEHDYKKEVSKKHNYDDDNY